jgi:fumarylacetoacetate (FAA) hydrolase
VKFASLRDGSQGGRLLIVSSDQSRAVEASAARTLLSALENWAVCERVLRSQAALLEANSLYNARPFDPSAVLAPLPRAPQWLDASAFRTHNELISRAWGTPNRFDDQVPLMYQGASDDMLPAHGPSYLPDEADDIDLEAEVAVVVDNVPMGVGADAALEHIKLIMLANDVSLRAYGRREMQSGFGFLQAKPSTVFSPLAVTPDELGRAWHRGRLLRSVTVRVNGRWVGSPNAAHMTFSFGELIAHAARTRRLSAGTIVGSGTVSDPDRTAGSATIVELQAVEKFEYGDVRTPFLKFGDRVEIEMLDESGLPLFGRIDHRILKSVADAEATSHA